MENASNGCRDFTMHSKNIGDKRILAYIQQAATSILMGDSAVGKKGGYVRQFRTDSFRTVGVTLDYRM